MEEENYEGGVGSRDDENDDPENAIEKGEVEHIDKTVPGEAVVYDNTGRRSSSGSLTQDKKAIFILCNIFDDVSFCNIYYEYHAFSFSTLRY